jgi:hypothetical protein
MPLRDLLEFKESTPSALKAPPEFVGSTPSASQRTSSIGDDLSECPRVTSKV